MEMDNTPIEGKSYVQEFLDAVTVREEVGNEYSLLLAEDKLSQVRGQWFELFCQELEILLKMQEVADEYIEYLKTKNQE